MSLVLFFSSACKNDIETIRALSNKLDLPNIFGLNIEITYTDSGMVKGKIMAPEVHDYFQREEPYTEFPKGIKAIFYNSNGQPESYIKANYALYNKRLQLWEGRGQVVAENTLKKEKLETDQIFWDQLQKKIYSDRYSTISNHDGIFYGEHGFEAKEDLSKWWMKGYKGKINVRNDLPPDEQ